ncbi:hypothetical protein AGDE_12998 [Angomonas deanei]|uniref:Zinc finger C-x8-C-x5-C-x3-H type (And similar)/CCCH-type zinc finger containing protein, putative n=1 Tax=Angomonas deanei TaxID=59799 RepID=A0A7G2C9R7_9TRYP|nr:hypothetical protein AGDE_12998 [Angomonas deanei]CAD2216600.1 Zinc finger C-x8-C-x5-C-x3-H type (and similar)/CCCH-type zinc finger containing protein, putative [Angomonas deanei]|eukprot:EPY23176.1 hypothetical protein AGDE_12998 [Angomonas deanei]
MNQQACRYFMKGKCVYGASCKYSHSTPSSQPTSRNPRAADTQHKHKHTNSTGGGDGRGTQGKTSGEAAVKWSVLEIINALNPSLLSQQLTNHLQSLSARIEGGQAPQHSDAGRKLLLQTERKCTQFLLDNVTILDFLTLSNCFFYPTRTPRPSLTKEKCMLYILLLLRLFYQHDRFLSLVKFKLLMKVQRNLQFCIYYQDVVFLQKNGAGMAPPMSEEMKQWHDSLVKSDVITADNFYQQGLNFGGLAEKTNLKRKNFVEHAFLEKREGEMREDKKKTDKPTDTVQRIFGDLRTQVTLALQLRAILLGTYGHEEAVDESNTDDYEAAVGSIPQFKQKTVEDVLREVTQKEVAKRKWPSQGMRGEADRSLSEERFWIALNEHLVEGLRTVTEENKYFFIDVDLEKHLLYLLQGLHIPPLPVDTQGGDAPRKNHKKRNLTIHEALAEVNAFLPCPTKDNGTLAGMIDSIRFGLKRNQKRTGKTTKKGATGHADPSDESVGRDEGAVDTPYSTLARQYIASNYFGANGKSIACSLECISRLLGELRQTFLKMDEKFTGQRNTGKLSAASFNAISFNCFDNPHYNISVSNGRFTRSNVVEGGYHHRSGGRFEVDVFTHPAVLEQIKQNILLPHCLSYAYVHGTPGATVDAAQLEKEANAWVDSFLVYLKENIVEEAGRPSTDDEANPFHFPHYDFMTNVEVLEKCTEADAKGGPPLIRWINRGELDLLLFDKESKTVFFIAEIKLNLADLTSAEAQRDKFFKCLDAQSHRAEAPSSPVDGNGTGKGKDDKRATTTVTSELMFGHKGKLNGENNDTDKDGTTTAAQKRDLECFSPLHFKENFSPNDDMKRNANWFYITYFTPIPRDAEEASKRILHIPAKGNERYLVENSIIECYSFCFTHFYSILIDPIVTDFVRGAPTKMTADNVADVLNTFVRDTIQRDGNKVKAGYVEFSKVPSSLRRILYDMFQSSFVFQYYGDSARGGCFEFQLELLKESTVDLNGESVLLKPDHFRHNINTEGTPLHLQDVYLQLLSQQSDDEGAESTMCVQGGYFDEIITTFFTDLIQYAGVFLPFFSAASVRIGKSYGLEQEGKYRANYHHHNTTEKKPAKGSGATSSLTFSDMLNNMTSNDSVRNVIFYNNNE